MGTIYKEVEVDVNTTVYEDIIIDEDDVVDYLKEYPDELEDILKRVGLEDIHTLGIQMRSVEDELKAKILKNAYNKYSLKELEEKLK
jgi:hypothetical protein